MSTTDSDTETTAPEKVSPPSRPAARVRGLRAASRPMIAALLVAVISVAVAAVAVFAWRTDDSADELAALRARLGADAAAEQAAATYALNVSEVKVGDIERWRTALQAGVTGQLAAKMSAAVDVVGPWLTQMEYSATAEPLAAKVLRRDGDLYVVRVFVDMNSRSRQTPEGVVATAAYTVTLDRAAGWTITDVGGVTPDLPIPASPTPSAPR
ncbi:hypothetical protein [Nocardia sp. NPDC005366]|uniref:hypothetical protein n=1 Tax=Nocardia sp. NPDC005366 TaxID=3156878 RepID=UPI0033ACF8B7